MKLGEEASLSTYKGFLIKQNIRGFFGFCIVSKASPREIKSYLTSNSGVSLSLNLKFVQLD
jgi:hypothetical protein